MRCRRASSQRSRHKCTAEGRAWRLRWRGKGTQPYHLRLQRLRRVCKAGFRRYGGRRSLYCGVLLRRRRRSDNPTNTNQDGICLRGACGLSICFGAAAALSSDGDICRQKTADAANTYQQAPECLRSDGSAPSRQPNISTSSLSTATHDCRRACEATSATAADTPATAAAFAALAALVTLATTAAPIVTAAAGLASATAPPAAPRE